MAGLFPDLPFMDQMGLTFVITAAIIAIISWLEGKGRDNEKGIPLTGNLFKTSTSFNIGAMVVMIITAILYALFW